MMTKDDASWISEREALWESRVKKELLQDFRKKDLKLLKSIYTGDLYPEFEPKNRGEPCAYFDLWSDREAPSYVGFFLWPNQSVEFWKHYHAQYYKPREGDSGGQREWEWMGYSDFNVDPRRYGWSDKTEREWTLVTLAPLFQGYVPEAPEPIFDLPPRSFPGAFIVWAGKVCDYLSGALFLRGDGDDEEYWSVNHDDRAVLSTPWMLKALKRMPEACYSENATEDELTFEGEKKLVIGFREIIRSIVWLTADFAGRYDRRWRHGVPGVTHLKFPVGDDYEKKMEFIEMFHAGLSEIPEAAALLDRAKNPKWKR